MKNWYSGLENRYASFPRETQILNMVSDMQKAANLWTSSPENARNHIYRAIILLDYIVADPKWKGRRRELLRLREVLAGRLVAGEHAEPFENIIRAALLLNPAAWRRLGGQYSEVRKGGPDA